MKTKEQQIEKLNNTSDLKLGLVALFVSIAALPAYIIFIPIIVLHVLVEKLGRKARQLTIEKLESEK